MEIILIILGALILLSIVLLFSSNNNILSDKRPKVEKNPEWYDRHIKRAKNYEQSHKKGTRVCAESKDGTWKEGVIYGNHDWHLFTFYFVVKFDDGEIIKQQESKVSLI